MKEYQFQYTSISQSFFVAITSIVMSVLTGFLLGYLTLNFLWLSASMLVVGFGVFRLLRGNAIHSCTAKLSETAVDFEFDDSEKNIQFSELTSYKFYDGKNGPILYLRTNTENFKLFTNENFCQSDDFKVFCNDIMAQLDRYRMSNPAAILIHEGSIFEKKGMLYFLAIATVAYLLALYFVPFKEFRIVFGLSIGSSFLLMWVKYFSANKKMTS